MNDLSFDIKTSVDFFKILKEDYAEFIKDKTSSRIALNCALKVWHLTDWIYNEYNTLLSPQFSSLITYQQYIKSRCSSLQIMNDISNGTKHYQLTRHSPIIKKTSLQMGAFDDSFSRDFDISTLDIELNDGSKIYFEDEIENAISYWENYFLTELHITIS